MQADGTDKDPGYRSTDGQDPSMQEANEANE